MRFEISPRPLGVQAAVGGLEQQLAERRQQELHLAGGGSVFVVVHADSVDGPVMWVEDGPGPWVGRARALAGQSGSLTPQGVADLVDGVVTPAVLGSMLRG